MLFGSVILTHLGILPVSSVAWIRLIGRLSAQNKKIKKRHSYYSARPEGRWRVVINDIIADTSASLNQQERLNGSAAAAASIMNNNRTFLNSKQHIESMLQQRGGALWSSTKLPVFKISCQSNKVGRFLDSLWLCRRAITGYHITLFPITSDINI